MTENAILTIILVVFGAWALLSRAFISKVLDLGHAARFEEAADYLKRWYWLWSIDPFLRDKCGKLLARMEYSLKMIEEEEEQPDA